MFCEQENDKNEENSIISQYAQEVLDYSSCYGSTGSISYSAVNICGRPCKFPNYGDFAECFSLRCYGPVLDREFSVKDIQDSVTFHDFVVIQFESFVLPKEISIYETYNPGSVVRIFAYCSVIKKWENIYEAQPSLVEKKSREFRPKIKKIKSPTRILRLEFNCSLVDYYIGIDAVSLKGVKCPLLISSPQMRQKESKIMMGLIQKKLETVQFMPQVVKSEVIEEFLKNDLNKFIDNVEKKEKIISDIPDEILYNVMTYLDLKSLYNCSKVCRKFNQISKDPLLYVEVNLKFYWHEANSTLIRSLHQRCNLIKKLDLSSCGYFKSILPEDFITFLRINGKTLTHLRINSCHFINTYCLQTIGFKCENLVELLMRNYGSSTVDREFMSLSLLSKLETLDLTKSGIDTFALLSVIKNNQNLQYLHLAFNHQLNIDQICLQISVHNKKLKLIDLWKCHNLTTVGLRALSNCEKLETVDLGWNLREESNITDVFKSLLQNCQNLKKLVLAAVRGIAERDLENVAVNCKNLEHLDLMGIVGMTSEAVFKILQHCERLKLLDLSFCENLNNATLIRWTNEYGVSIKRSEVPGENQN